MASYSNIDTTTGITIASSQKEIETTTTTTECVCSICFRVSSSTTTGNNATSKILPVKKNTIDFAYSDSCGHTFCLPCIQQALLAPTNPKRTMTAQRLLEQDRIVTITQGSCPICRIELSYFDLKKIYIHPMNDTSRIDNENGLSTTGGIVKSNDSVATLQSIPKELFGGKFILSDQSFLQFPTFMNDQCTKGVQLFIADKPTVSRNKKSPPLWKTVFAQGMMKLTGCQYIPDTHTFQGQWKKLVQEPDVYAAYTVWMSFADNFLFVTHGACRATVTKRQYENVKGESYPQLRTDVESFVHPFGVTKRSWMFREICPISTARVRCDTTTFWGNTFCQNYKIGMASYHFEKMPKQDGSNALAYISYSHPMSGILPPLDNGRPLPSRVLFRNIVCPNMYTFRGSICWYDDYNTTWNGMSRWDYEIEFDTKFLCIKSGSVRSVAMDHVSDGDTSEIAVVKNTSVFGENLIYVNTEVYDRFIDGHVSLQMAVASPFMQEITFLSSMQIISTRLTAEGVTEATQSEWVRVLFLGSNRFMTTQAPQFYARSDENEQDYPTDNVQNNF